MKVENPAAFHFIMQDDIYLLNADKHSFVPADVAPVSEPVTEAQPVIETKKIAFNYLGKNGKRFVVFVHYPANEFMHDVHQTALENTLKRKDLTFDDVAIVNLAPYATATFDELNTYFGPQKLLIMGNNALPQGFAELPFNQSAIIGALPALLTFSFDDMMTSNDNKKAFWEQVKNF